MVALIDRCSYIDEGMLLEAPANLASVLALMDDFERAALQAELVSSGGIVDRRIGRNLYRFYLRY